MLECSGVRGDETERWLPLFCKGAAASAAAATAATGMKADSSTCAGGLSSTEARWDSTCKMRGRIREVS